MERRLSGVQWTTVLLLITVLFLVGWLLCVQAATVAQGTATPASTDTVAATATATATLPPTPVPTVPIPTGVGSSLQIGMEVSPHVVAPGQEATARVRVRGLRLAQCAGSPARPVDAMLVIDNSGSAGMGSGSNLEGTKVWAASFLDYLSQPIYTEQDTLPDQSRAALMVNEAILTGTLPLVEQPLTEDLAAVRDSVTSLTTGGDVSAAELIRSATNQLIGRDARRAGLIFLMLHDRQPLEQSSDVEQAIREAQQVGIKVHALVNNRGISSPDRVTSGDLDSLFQPNQYWIDPAPGEMRDVFVQAADGAVDLAGRDIVLRSQFLDPGVATVLDVEQGGYVEGDQVVWRLHHLRSDDEVELSYSFYVPETVPPGQYLAQIGGSYLDCNGYLTNRPLGDPAQPPLAEYEVRVAYPPPPPEPLTIDGYEYPYVTPTPVFVFTQTHPFLEVQHDVAPDSGLFREDEYLVSVTLFGTGSKCPPTVRRYPVDAVLVLDRSGSMADAFGSTSKMEEAKKAAIAFVDEFARSSGQTQADRVGVIAFESGAQVVHEMSQDRDLLRQAIEEIEYGGGTDIAGSLQTAQELLGGSRRAGVSQVIVLLSDGQSDYSSAMRWASDIKDEDVRIVTVGLGYDTDDRLMRDIASDFGDYHFAAPGSSLEDMFRDIAIQARRAVPATNIRVVHTYDSDRFEIIKGSPEPVANTDQPGKVIWEVDEVDLPDTELSYRIRPKIHGLYPVLHDAEVIFTSCEARDEAMLMGEDDALEANTLLPSKVLTTTLPVTVNVQINPPPYGTAKPSQVNDLRLRLCESGFCWPLALLLLLLLLLIFLFLTPWGRRLIRWFRNAKPLCKLFSLLLLLWLLLLIPFLARALVTGVCVDQNTLVFWRIEDQDSRLYYAEPAPTRQIEPYEVDRHEQDCVGCHIVSGASNLMAISSESSGDWAGELTIQRTDGAAGIVAGLRGSYFAWSPDGHKLAFSHQDKDIHIVDLDTRTTTPLPGGSDPNLVETMPAWSADGSSIAFVRPQDPTSGGFAISGPSDIYAVPVAGGEPLLLTGASEGGINYYPQYSPDGRWLMFTSAPSGSSYANPDAKIFVMPATGGKPLPIQANEGPGGAHIEHASNTWATWSPDGTTIYFNSKRDGSYDTYMADFEEVEEETQSGIVYRWQTSEARPVPEVNTSNFEHLAYEVGPAEPVTVFTMLGWAWWALLRLWPFFLILPLLLFLWWLFCRAEEVIRTRIPRETLLPGGPLPPWDGPKALWDPDPALVIGLGGTGRRVLAYLKKNMMDAGAGSFPEQVRFMLIDTTDEEPATTGWSGGEFTGVRLDKEADGIFALKEDMDELITRMGRQPDSEPELQTWFPVGQYQALSETERHLSAGTRQRRPLARAGVFREMQLRRDETEGLWKRLVTGAEAAKDEDGNLRVALVGSLAGGLGSGILADIAYLARKAGREAKAKRVTIEAYLATDKVFSALMDDRSVAATNTSATLRELQRLQVAGKQPYGIRYKRAPGDDVLDGQVERQLLDEMYLFDGGALMGVEPIKWLYPTMADSITLLLDPVSREHGEHAVYREGIQGDATREQQSAGQAVVSGLGSFQVRTPLPDMIEALATRWAGELLTLLLIGRPKGQIVLQSTQNQEEPSSRLDERVREFLSGHYDYQAPIPSPIETGVLEQLMAEEMGKQTLQRGLKRMSIKGEEQERQVFRAYLNAALVYLLNGSSQSNPLIARSGKIAYGLSFLAMLEEEVQRVSGRGKGLRGLNRAAQSQLQTLRDVMPVYEQEISAARKVLAVQRDLIAPPARVTPESERMGSIMGRLADHRRQLLKWRGDMNEIQTRRYLGYGVYRGEPEDEVLEEWYDRYLLEQLEKNLDRLHWLESADGQIQLSLRSWDDTVLRTEPEELDRFAEALLALARYVARDLWEQERNALPDLLGEEMLDTRRADGLVDGVMDRSRPLLECDLSAARRSTLHVALAGTQEALEAGDMERNLRRRMPAQRQLSALETADPCALTTVQTQDLVPLSASYAAQDADRLYQAHDGLLWGNEQSAVFAAEEHARQLEVRLPEIRQQPRTLHPMVVAGMEDMARARLYALGYAGGYVVLEHHPDRVSVQTPDRPAIALTGTQPSDASDTLHPLVLGLNRFSALPEEQARYLATMVEQGTPEMVEQWRAWTNGIPRTDELGRDGRPEAKDLGDVIALLVREALQSRQH